MNIPQKGVDERKVAFFAECSAAFEFLSIYHSLSAEEQLKMMQLLTKLKGTKK